MKLFNRKALVVVDAAIRGNSAAAESLGVVPALSMPCGKDGFDCRFEVRKDLTGKPNRARIEVYNLTQDHRDSLSERAAKGPTRVRLEAGYEHGTSRIFEGDVRILYHSRDTGSDWVTMIESGDGDHILSSSRISKAWGPGTPVSTVIQDIADELELGEGNLKQVTEGAILEGLGTTFVDGTAACGRAFDALTRLTKSAGLEWSIQDGTLQFLASAKALSGTAIKLTPDTGMEDHARIDHKRRLHVKARLIPNLFPGRKIQLEDGSVWRVDKARYHGETHGSAWNILIEATPL